MAQIGDLSLFITAETKRATDALRQVDVVANKVVKPRSIVIGADTQNAVVNIGKVNTEARNLNKSLLSTNSALKNTGSSFDAGKLANEFIYLNKRVESVKDSINELRETLKLIGAGKVVDIADSIGVTLLARFNPKLFQDQITQGVVQGVKAGANTGKNILYKNFFRGVSEGVTDALNNLARIGFAGQGLLFIVQPIKAAFEGLFNFTIGQNIQLQDTILSTATTLATTADVIAANGDRILDPFERITALQRPVENAIDSIRERSLKLAGVTSSQVVDVFSVVATNIGQINGSLKDAEDLSIAFTASLGTLGIPLFQARQEIGSILGGYITEDSLLARRLGITNEQVREAKTQVGGVTKFLLDKLSTAEAGQAILAKGFRGVTSNIAELFELIGLAVGKPFLDPLVNSLNATFEALFKFKQILTELGQLISGTIVGALQVAFEPFANSEFVANMGKQFKAITEPLKELQNLTKGDKGSFLQRAITGTNPDQVPKVLQSAIKGLRDINNEVKRAARSAGDPINRIFTDERKDTGLSNPMPQRIAGLFLLDTQAFTKGWDTVQSTLEEVSKSFGNFAVQFAKFKIREAADYIRLLADTITLLGNAFLGAANFVASFANVVSSLLQMPLIQYFNQLRMATQLVGISDFVDNLKILTVVTVGVKESIESAAFALDNYKKGIMGIALASKAASGGMAATSTALQGLSLSGRIFAVGGDITARVMDKLGGALGYTESEIQKVKASFGTMDSSMKVVKNTLRGLIGQMIVMNAIFIGINLALGFLITTFSNWMEAQRKARREAELLNKVTKTTANELIELSNSADPVKIREFNKRMRESDEVMEDLGEKIDEDTQKIEKLQKTIKALEDKGIRELIAAQEELNNTPIDERRGLDFLNKELALRNKIETSKIGINSRAIVENFPKLLSKLAKLEEGKEQKLAKYRAELRKKQAVEAAKELEKEATLMGKRRTDLEKEIAKFRTDLNREIENKEFSARMDNDRRRAQAELQAAQLRIRIDKQRALELLEGEEGAAAEAKRALAEYIATRDNAEAERQNDEASFQIEMATMARDLENYKIGIQEKITEMQKKVGQYQKQVADYLLRKAKNEADIRANGATRAREATQSGKATGVTGLREGTTGTSTGNHFHVEGVGFTPSEAGARAIFAEDVRSQLTTNSPPGMRTHPKTGEQRYHAGYDLAGPNGTGQGLPFNLAEGYAVTDFKRNLGGYGNQATVTGPDGIQYTVSHLADPGADFKLPKAGATTAPTAVEEIPVPEFPDLSLGGDTSGLDEQLERTRALEIRLKNIRNLIRDADTAQAFEAIAKTLFKLPGVQKLENEQKLLKERLKLTMQIEDPERISALAKIESQRIIENLAYDDARKEVLKKFGESSQELADFDEQALARKDAFLERLKLQEEETIKLIDLSRQLAIVQDLSGATRQGVLNTQQSVAQGLFGMRAGTEYSTFDRNRLLAEGRIESKRLEMVDQNEGQPLKGDALKKFEEFRAQELVNADQIAQLEGLQQRFEQLGQAAAGVGDAIGTAFTDGFADILTGSASVNDVLSDMFSSIGKSFMNLAKQIIADMIKMLVFKSLLGLFGGGAGVDGSGLTGLFGGSPGASSSDSFAGVPNNILDSVLGSPKPFANGGIVTGPTPALIGEGGMNEAVVPLPNGKAIPVDLKGMKGAGGVTSNVTVNVNNEGGGKSDMSGDDAGKLGKAIDGAIRKVIMDERRSGGLLYSGR